MNLKMDKAVLLAVRCFHKDYENFEERSVHIHDVARAVTRILRVRDDRLLKELVIDDAKQAVFNLQNREFLKFDSLVSREVYLTKAGAKRAAAVERSQLRVDAGVVGRVQNYTPSEVKTKLGQCQPDYQETADRMLQKLRDKQAARDTSRDHELAGARSQSRGLSLGR